MKFLRAVLGCFSFLYNNSKWFIVQDKRSNYAFRMSMFALFIAVALNLLYLNIFFLVKACISNYFFAESYYDVSNLLRFLLFSIVAVVSLVFLALRLESWEGSFLAYLLSCNIFSQLLSTNSEELANSSKKDYLSSFNEAQEVVKIYGFMNIYRIVNSLFVPVWLCVIFYYSSTLVVLSLLSLLMVKLLLLAFSTKLFLLKDLYLGSRDELMDGVYGFLSKFTFIKALGAESWFRKLYSANSLKAHEDLYRFNSGKYFFGVMTKLVILLSTILMILIGFNHIVIGEYNVVTLLFVVCVNTWILFSISALFSVFEEIFEKFDSKQKVDFPFLCKADFRDFNYSQDSSSTSLKITDLSLMNNKKNEQILRNINLEVVSGEFLAVIDGKNDAKQSFLQIILGRVVPTCGIVSVGGNNVSDLSHIGLYYDVGLLPSTPVIYEGSILDNLTMFGMNSEQLALYYSRLLGVEKIVALLPNGYSTMLSSSIHSSELSRSVLQLISIIRALVYQPKFLVYDHAEALLDKESYNKFFEILLRLKRHQDVGMLIFSNDYNILKLSDQDYVLNYNGELEKCFFDHNSDLFSRKNLSLVTDFADLSFDI